MFSTNLACDAQKNIEKILYNLNQIKEFNIVNNYLLVPVLFNHATYFLALT